MHARPDWMPAYYSSPPRIGSLGKACSDFAAKNGLILDPWQNHAAHEALGVADKSGKWSAIEVGILVPRQNGKGSIIEAVELFHFFVLRTGRIVHTAHRAETANEGFDRFVNLIDGSPRLRKVMPKNAIRRSNGSAGVRSPWGRIIFRTRSAHNARGMQGDLVFFDEAYHLSMPMISALIPTLSSRKNPQIWYTSSTGWVDSYQLKSLKEQGRVGVPSLTWLEWCAKLPTGPDGERLRDSEGKLIPLNLDDPAVMRQANPGPRITWAFTQVERRRMKDDPDSFMRERYGIWEELDDERSIKLAAWDACADPAARRLGKVGLAIDVSPALKCGCILAVSETANGRRLIEIVEHFDDVNKIPAKVKAIRGRKNISFVGLDPSGPAAVLIPEFTRLRVKLADFPQREAAAASSMFVADINGRKLVHLGDPLFKPAVEGVVIRPTGDGSVRLTRSKSTADICLLYAASIGNWLLSKVASPEKWKPTDGV